MTSLTTCARFTTLTRYDKYLFTVCPVLTRWLAQPGSCSKALSGKSSTDAVFCGDIPNAIFLKSPNGYDNMDVDCDGADDKAGDCSNDPSGYGETAFKDTVKSYGIPDLNANIHPYVVFNEKPYFDPGKYGMKPLSVMAVVCNNQLVSFISSMFVPSWMLTYVRVLVVRCLGRYQPRAHDGRGVHLTGQAVLPQRPSHRRQRPRAQGRSLHWFHWRPGRAGQERSQLEGPEQQGL